MDRKRHSVQRLWDVMFSPGLPNPGGLRFPLFRSPLFSSPRRTQSIDSTPTASIYSLPDRVVTIPHLPIT
jgi:hypothetical protein